MNHVPAMAFRYKWRPFRGNKHILLRQLSFGHNLTYFRPIEHQETNKSRTGYDARFAIPCDFLGRFGEKYWQFRFSGANMSRASNPYQKSWPTGRILTRVKCYLEIILNFIIVVLWLLKLKLTSNKECWRQRFQYVIVGSALSPWALEKHYIPWYGI